MTNLLWKAVEGFYVCVKFHMHFYLFPHILQRQTVCAGVMVVIWTFYWFCQWPFRVCACFTEQKKHLCLVNVHYSPLVHVASLPTHWQLHGDRALEVKCISLLLRLPCFVLVYLLNVQQSSILAFLMS